MVKKFVIELHNKKLQDVIRTILRDSLTGYTMVALLVYFVSRLYAQKSNIALLLIIPEIVSILMVTAWLSVSVNSSVRDFGKVKFRVNAVKRVIWVLILVLQFSFLFGVSVFSYETIS